MINIALCTDDNYAVPCAVCITSILENNKKDVASIYVLTEGLSEKTKKIFERLSDEYKVEIKLVVVDALSFNGLKRDNRFPRAIYFRFLLPSIVKDDRILYLDCDTIVCGNLSGFYTTNLENKSCAVIEDQMSDDIYLRNRLDLRGKYFNSGVLLMNLVYWRENLLSEKIVNFISCHPELCMYPDQDALNLVIGDSVLFCEYKYNLQEMMLFPHEKLCLSRDKWDAVDESKMDPVVVHYTNSVKPWHRDCRHPLKGLYEKYLKKHPFLKSRKRMKYNYAHYFIRACIAVGRHLLRVV